EPSSGGTETAHSGSPPPSAPHTDAPPKSCGATSCTCSTPPPHTPSTSTTTPSSTSHRNRTVSASPSNDPNPANSTSSWVPTVCTPTPVNWPSAPKAHCATTSAAT